MADQDQDQAPAPAPAPAQLAVAQVSPAGQLPADKGGQPESAAGPGAAAAAGDTGARDTEIGDSAGGGSGPSTSRPAEHVVSGRETVASIAAMYEVTPSELVSANKLGMARLVFPGQVSRVQYCTAVHCGPRGCHSLSQLYEHLFCMFWASNSRPTHGHNLVMSDLDFLLNSTPF